MDSLPVPHIDGNWECGSQNKTKSSNFGFEIRPSCGPVLTNVDQNWQLITG